MTPGTYTLLTSSSLAAGQGGGPGQAPTFQPPLARQTVNLDYATANTIKLDVLNSGQQANLTWKNTAGGDGSSWDIANTKNWISTASILDPNEFYNGDNVTFDDNNNGNYNVNINQNVTPNSLTVNTANTYTFNGNGILGATSLTKTGTGTLLLQNNNNAYSGGTFVKNGILEAGSGSALSPNSAITLGDGVSNTSGVLDLNGNTITVGGLATAGTGAGNIIGNSSPFGSATLVFDGGTSTFGGIIQDHVGTGTQTTALQVATGTLILTANATYTGGTNVASGATLQLGNNTPAGAVAGDMQVDGTVIFARSNTLTYNGVISSSGSIVEAGSGTTILTGSMTNSGATTINGGMLQLGNGGATGMLNSAAVSGTGGALAFNRSDTFSFTNTIGGAVGVSQIGTGSVTLSATNTYTGNTTITGGTLVVTNNASLGSLTSGVVSIAGGTLDIGGNPTANNVNFGAKQFNISGTGAGGVGALINSSTSNQINAFQKVTLTADASVGGTGRFDIRGGTPVLDLGGHTLTKTGTNQFALVGGTLTGGGSIDVTLGLFSFQTTSSTSGTGSITYEPGINAEFYQTGAGKFNWDQYFLGNNTLGSANGTAANVNGNMYLEGDIFVGPTNGTAGQAPASNFPLNLLGTISEIGGSYGITKYGVDTVTVSGANSFSGNTTITGGTLLLGNALALQDSTLNYNNQGGALSFGSLTNATFGGLSGASESGADKYRWGCRRFDSW